MMRRTIARVTAVVLLLLGTLLGPGSLLSPSEVQAQSMLDYTSNPVNMPMTTPPNILFMLDTSRSMYKPTYDASAFDPTNEYGGIFDPFDCYQYQSNRFQPDPAANPATIPSSCGSSYPWSGNFMNYMTMRRHDIMKWALVGGWCAVARDSSGNCTRVKGADVTGFTPCCEIRRTSVSAAQATGRVDASVLTNVGATLYFHLMGDQPNLTGGFCTDNDSSAPGTTDANCNTGDADAYAETFFKIVVDHPENATGIINEAGSTARFAIMQWNTAGSGDGSRIVANMGADLLTLGNAIDNAHTNSTTPLAESLYEAVRYYAQLTPAFPASDYTVSQATDPYYFTAPQWAGTSSYASCCKSYVIYLTDGGQWSDTNIPASLQDYAYKSHNLKVDAAGNFVLPIATDPLCPASTPHASCPHHTNDYSSPGPDGPGVHFMDDVAYYAHITDLRQGTLPILGTGNDLSGVQKLTIYTFLIYDPADTANQRSLMQLAARAGGFVDSNGNDLPDLQSEWDSVVNATGAAGQDGFPDTFFESSQGELMKDRLTAAITSIMKQSTSGTSASVLASSTTGEGTAYQAYYYPSDPNASATAEVKWTGYTHALFVDAFGNIREDTNGDGKLVYTQDNIVITRYDSAAGEVLVDRYADANGDGKADSSSCSPCGIRLTNLATIWEAGKRLALKDPATRNIITWADLDYDGFVDAGEQMAFTTANSATLGPILRAGAAPFTADNIINFIRGTQITGLRNRQMTVAGSTQVWKLGDIVNSTPSIVGPPKERYDVIYGDSSYTDFFTQYKNRRMVAYVGANDGMLHAFNVGFYHRGDDPNTGSATEHGWFTRTATDNSGGALLGEELWGFIPHHLLPQLQWLTRADYGHTYYVDMKPKVTDVRIFTADADHPNGWGTILIGGFRLGGSCKQCNAGQGKEMAFQPGGTGNTRAFWSTFFVMDITNPEVDPKLLWIFTDTLLGMTTSYPTVLRVNPLADAKTSNTNAKWFVLFGTGPSGYTGASEIDGHVYIVDLKLGPGLNNDATAAGNNNNANVEQNPAGGNKSFIGDIISLDANLDYRTDVMYFGANLDTGGTPKWEGKLYRLTTGNQGLKPFGGDVTPANWGLGSKPTWFLYDFGCTPSPGCSGPKKPGSILTAPTVTMDDSLNVWVFVGTGRFWNSTDKSLTETQYFFGIKDDVINGTCTQGSDRDCQQKDLVNVSSAVVCSTCASGTNQVTDPNNVAVTTLTGTATTTLQGLVASKEGWYTSLLPSSGPAVGERVLASPTLLGGIVFFPSFIPEVGNVCTGGTGTSSLYALFYLTGSAYKVSVVGTDTVGGNTNVKRSTALGAGVASQVRIHMGAQGTDSATGVTSRSRACSQMSTGALTCIQTQPALSAWSRYLSWINLRL